MSRVKPGYGIEFGDLCDLLGIDAHFVLETFDVNPGDGVPESLQRHTNTQQCIPHREEGGAMKVGAINRKCAKCKWCKRYPCFRGIENISTNLAQTCHDFIKSK